MDFQLSAQYFGVEVGKGVVERCAGGTECLCLLRRKPFIKLLVTSVTSEILVAYIILDIDGEVDGQGVLALAQKQHADLTVCIHFSVGKK